MKNILSLPPYPFEADMWDQLAKEKRPIVIYGMGNGADKLMNKAEEYGIKFADIFASDGFVRGHSFRGMRVKSFSEIKEIYGNFVIALSFASSRPEVLGLIKEINKSYDLVAPDMPVAGDEYFTKDFYNSNYDKIVKVYESLGDEQSKNLFSSVIWYKLTGKIDYLFENTSTTEDIYGLFGEEIRTIADCGAYNGDTLKEAIRFFPMLEKAYAFEPDRRNFKKLTAFAECADIKIEAKKAAVWSRCVEGELLGSGNRNSTVNATASYENRVETVELVSLDEAIDEEVDYIKYDVEGAEREALLGSFRIIGKYAPRLLVSLYHRSEDIFTIPELIAEKFPAYRLYLRRTECLPAWEIALIAL